MKPDTTLKFIGEIKQDTDGFVLALEKPYASGLQGLSEFSHAVVLWWAHDCASETDRRRTVIAKPYKNSSEDVGVLGSRSPFRPNPIGMTVVQIGEVDVARGRVVVPYIDTLPGTPLLDIKPYFPASDRVENVCLPKWCRHWPDSVEASADFDWAGEFE